MSATAATPIIREAGRADVLDTAHHMLGTVGTSGPSATSTTVTPLNVAQTSNGLVTSNVPSSTPTTHSPPVGTALPMANGLI